MSDNMIEDSDDFDIYADLEEDNNDYNNTYNGLTESVFELNDKQIENTVINTNSNYENIETKCDINNTTNDMILSELTILEKRLEKTEENNKNLIKEKEELKKQLIGRDKQLLVLKTNISSLYKTAKAEIERKKKEINELREQLDSIIFKRLPQKTNTNINTFDENNRQISEQNVAKSSEQKLFCDKSTNTSDKDFRHNSNEYNNQKKSSYTSIKSIDDSKSGQRSRSRRSRSRDRNRHKTNTNGERDSNSGSKRKDDDRSGSKTSETKRHKSDKYSDRK